MSIRLLTFAVTLLAASFSLVTMSHAQSMPKEMHESGSHGHNDSASAVEDHEAMAIEFEAEASQFEQQAAQHDRLAKKYRTGSGGAPKGNSASMAAHCERIAKNLKAAATDARAMTRMHREMALNSTK